MLEGETVSQTCNFPRRPIQRRHRSHPQPRAVLDGTGNTAAACAPPAATSTTTYSEPTLLATFEENNKALDKLKELGIEGSLFEHQTAMTVQEQLKALGSVTGEKTKNLFLKAREGDSDSNCCCCCSSSSSSVDDKPLSRRAPSQELQHYRYHLLVFAVRGLARQHVTGLQAQANTWKVPHPTRGSYVKASIRSCRAPSRLFSA